MIFLRHEYVELYTNEGMVCVEKGSLFHSKRKIDERDGDNFGMERNILTNERGSFRVRT